MYGKLSRPTSEVVAGLAVSEYARSDRVIVPESEMGYLVQAEARLQELEAMNAPIECPT